MTDKEDAYEAVEVLERFKRVEDDNDHKDSLENVQRLIVGVYDLEVTPPCESDLELVRNVLEDIDSGEQFWHDAEYVDKQQERGLNWVEHGIDLAKNPHFWGDS